VFSVQDLYRGDEFSSCTQGGREVRG
jgi:hypothetical protein